MAFYLELTSESTLYEENTPSNFRVKLNQPIDLDGNWEVSLNEIYFPKTTLKHLWAYHKRGRKYTRYPVTGGYYFSSIEELMPQLSKLIPGVNVRYIKPFRKISFTIPRNEKLSFSTELAKILGFKPHHFYSGLVVSEDVVNVENIKPIIFQSSLIYPISFGDTTLPALRTIYQNGGHIEFSPKYLPVIDSTLEELSFKFTDKDNQLVNCVPGEVYLSLHFKKCSQV